MSFWGELKRRRVVRSLTVYLAAAWLVAQIVSEVAVPALGLGDAALRWVAILAVLGIPVVAALSWAFDVSPAPLETAASVDPPSSESWLSLRAVVAVVVLLAVGASLGWIARSDGESQASGELDRSVAVLPFESLTGEDDRYLSDGLTEDVVVALQKAAELEITGRASTERYRGSGLPPSNVARELGVRYVLTGSVRRAGEQVRVSVQLHDGRDDRGLWGEQYDQQLTVDNVFEMYTDVAQSVVTSVRARVAPDAEERLAERPTESLVAYERYLRGRSFWTRRLPELMPTAIEFFDRAIEEDPSYARAHAGRADALLLQGFYLPGDEARQALRAARQAAARALELDAGLAEAHTSLGYAKWLADWDWTGAEASLRRALELNPGYSVAHHWLGDLLSQQLRTREGLSHLDRALELDPYAVAVHFDKAKALHWAERYEEAVTSFDRVLEIEPTYFTVTAGLHFDALRGAGRDDEAFRVIARFVEADVGPEAMAALRAEYEADGIRAIDDFALEEAAQLLPEEQDFFFLGSANATLGRNEEALQALRQGVERRSFFSLTLYASPPIRGLLWGDPRYDELLRGIGLEPSRLTGRPQ